jgi:hypothetical protein
MALIDDVKSSSRGLTDGGADYQLAWTGSAVGWARSDDLGPPPKRLASDRRWPLVVEREGVG